jgi:hypothetical protein
MINTTIPVDPLIAMSANGRPVLMGPVPVTRPVPITVHCCHVIFTGGLLPGTIMAQAPVTDSSGSLMSGNTPAQLTTGGLLAPTGVAFPAPAEGPLVPGAQPASSAPAFATLAIAAVLIWFFFLR